MKRCPGCRTDHPEGKRFCARRSTWRRTQATVFDAPVLLIHGESASHCVQKSYLGVAHLWRYDAPGMDAADAISVDINLGGGKPFEFHSLTSGGSPAACE